MRGVASMRRRADRLRAERRLLRRDDERDDATGLQPRGTRRRRAEISAESLRQAGDVLTERGAASGRLSRGLRVRGPGEYEDPSGHRGDQQPGAHRVLLESVAKSSKPRL